MPQRIKILIACHRPYPVPDEPCYLWLETTGYPYAELPYVFTEKQNWIRKGTAFIKRKITYKSHEK